MSEIEERPAALKTTNEGYRERWLAKRPRPNPNTWLSGFCSACEQAGGDQGLPSLTLKVNFRNRLSQAAVVPRCFQRAS